MSIDATRRDQLSSGNLTLAEAVEALELGLAYDPARMPHVPEADRWLAHRSRS